MQINLSEKKLYLILCDTGIVCILMWFFINHVLKGTYDAGSYNGYIFIMGCVTYFFVAAVLELYSVQSIRLRYALVRYLIAGVSFCVILYFIMVFLINTTVSRMFLSLFMMGTPLVIMLHRYMFHFVFYQRMPKQSVFYIYDKTYDKDCIAQRIRQIEGSPIHTGYKVKVKASNKNDCLFQRKIIQNIIAKIDVYILDVKPDHLTQSFEKSIYRHIYRFKQFETFNSFCEKTYEKVNLENWSSRLFYLTEAKNQGDPYTKIFEVMVNFFMVLAGSIVLLIIIPILYIMNIFFNRGPLFYSQNRIGKYGRTFKLYKFRSMKPNAEQSEEQMALAQDNRVTPLGKVLRLFRIDELPQIISIIKGDMNFIGPRPEWTKTAKKFSKKIPLYHLRHLVRPGITGWAQINQGHTTSMSGNYEKLQYDLYYIKERSILINIRIIVKTISTIVFSRGV